MKNQDDLYQNDVGSTFHNLAFTTWVIAIAVQKIIDVICFCFKFLKSTPKGVLSFQAVKLTGLHLSSLSSRLVNLNKPWLIITPYGYHPVSHHIGHTIW